MKRFTLPLALLLIACNPPTETSETEPETNDERPNVVINTELGPIEIEVYLDAAPISGADFLAYVDAGLYDDQAFYRAVRPDNDPRDMGMSLIQGGILGIGDDVEPPLPPIAHELTTDTGLSNTEGVISIARSEPGSGSAAWFFINIGDNSFLDTGGNRNPDGQGYATFGRVVDGMDVVREIQAQDTTGASPFPATENQYLSDPVAIIDARRLP